MNKKQSRVSSSIRQPADQPSSKWGFTLVEMLMFLGIFSMLLVILTNIFSTSLDVQKESEATSSVQQDGAYIITRLTYDITRATSITTPSVLGSQSSSLAIIIAGVTNTYALTSGNLTLTDASGANLLNGYDTSISNLTFKRYGNVGGKNTIQINFTVTSKTQQASGFEIKNFQTTAGLR